MRKTKKHIFLTLIGALCLVVVGYHLTNHFVHSKLTAFLNNIDKSPIQNFENLKVNIWKGQLQVNNIELKWPHSELNIANRLKSKSIQIQGINFYKVWKDNKVIIDYLEISDSEVHLISQNTSSDASSIKQKKNINLPLLSIDSIVIKNTSLSKYGKDKEVQTKLKLVNFKSNNLKIENWIEPHTWYNSISSYELKLEDVFHKATKWEIVEVEEVLLTDQAYKIENLSFHTELSKEAYNAQLSQERDHYSVKIPEIIASPFEWIKHNERHRFFTDSIVLSTPSLKIYRDKLLPDDTSYKPLFSQLLRDLNFDIQTNQLKINEGNIVYTERVKEENSGGSIFFSHFNSTIKDAGNFKEINAKKELHIEVKTAFMETAKLTANWRFNPQDINDAFHFQARISQLDATQANLFTEPNLFVKMEGRIDELFLNTYGNKKASTTDIAISYHKLKVELLNKKDKGKRRIISAIANIFLKKDSDKNGEMLKEESVEVMRDQTKSIFNFLWQNTLQGLKQATI